MFLRKKLEEVNLHKQVHDKMDELNVDFITLARMAHIFVHGTDPDQTQTYINWKQHGLVPSYVEKFLNQ